MYRNYQPAVKGPEIARMEVNLIRLAQARHGHVNLQYLGIFHTSHSHVNLQCLGIFHTSHSHVNLQYLRIFHTSSSSSSWWSLGLEDDIICASYLWVREWLCRPILDLQSRAQSEHWKFAFVAGIQAAKWRRSLAFHTSQSCQPSVPRNLPHLTVMSTFST